VRRRNSCCWCDLLHKKRRKRVSPLELGAPMLPPNCLRFVSSFFGAWPSGPPQRAKALKPGLSFLQETATVELVCAAFGNDFNLRAAIPAIFRGVTIRDDSYVLHRLLVGVTTAAPPQVKLLTLVPSMEKLFPLCVGHWRLLAPDFPAKKWKCSIRRAHRNLEGSQQDRPRFLRHLRKRQEPASTTHRDHDPLAAGARFASELIDRGNIRILRLEDLLRGGDSNLLAYCSDFQGDIQARVAALLLPIHSGR